MILFLDFDGVTHCAFGTTAKFSQLPLLEAVLRDYPQVQIVLSTSWREAFPHDILQECLGELGPRLVGMTPVITEGRHVRQREIEAWLTSHPSEQRWVALDDMPELFEEHCPWVIFCHPKPGFDEATAAVLVQHLT